MRAGDEAVSDFIGTVLLVGLVVVLGSVLSVVVAANLDKAAPPAATLSLGAVQPGDTDVRLILKQGEALPLDAIAITLQRNVSQSEEVPRAAWATVDGTLWRAGETLSLPLTPAAGQGETFRVTVVSLEANAVLAKLQGRAPFLASTSSPLGTPTLLAVLTPPSLVADATSASTLAVRVSHPAGALGVAGITADLVNITGAAGTAPALLQLGDLGREGDAAGGDGVWSALLRAPINTTVGSYNVTVNATDLTGRLVASTVVNVTISRSLLDVASSITNATGVIANFTGNFSGTCVGCTVTNGSIAFEGTRLNVPTSQNITTFRIRNFTYDRLDPDRLDGDAFVARVIGNTHAWSVYFRLEYTASIASIIRMEMWDSNGTTVYLPTANGRVPIDGLSLDMLNPAASGFTCSTGCASPKLYSAANVQGAPVFVVAWMRDETNNFQTDELGIYAVDAVVS